MFKHASTNRVFRLVRNEALDCWVPVAEIARGRRKRKSRPSGLLAILLALSGVHAGAQVGVAPPVSLAPPPNELPTGGTVVAGSAILRPGGNPGTAVLNIDQSTQRAVIDWNTFNVGSEAQVNFNQPGRDSATLNRVQDSNPSQIFGTITATGQVFLTNPNGVHFARSASVDVGGLAATTHSIDNADFMAGNITLERAGATGSVTNEGELRAQLGGYIALLAPEVRNSGVIVAQLGTVAMASGEVFTLNFSNHQLASISVTRSAIAALVENRGAVLAPGGLIVLSAQAMDRLQGGVVNNSGALEATGLSMRGGRVVLEASDRIVNSGSIAANAGSDGSPAGEVSLAAPEVLNTGSISASADAVLASGGSISLSADQFTQSAAGAIDVSGANGGEVSIVATQDVSLAGRIDAAGLGEASAGEGGKVSIAAGRDVTLQSAIVDASGHARGGAIAIAAGTSDPAPNAPPLEPPTAALIGGTQLRTSSRRGNGGTVSLTGERVGLFDTTTIDASGASGGGNVFVGGGFHGQDPSIANARQVVVGTHARIDASATHSGDGGRVAIWSDGQTRFGGHVAARGGSVAGAGGFVEVSGKENLDFRGLVDAGAEHGEAGTLLLDPRNIIIDAGGAAALTDVDQFADNAAGDSTIAPSTIIAMTNAGTAVTLQANNDITINSAISSLNPSGNGGAMTFRAGRSITLNSTIFSDNGDISFTVNDSGADANRIAGTDAVFLNNGLIDAGTGTLSITMGTKDQSGSIGVGQVGAGTLNITHNGPTAGAVTGAIDLGEMNIANNMSITANSARNITNTLGSVIVRGTATISVGTGDVTINRATTDFNIIGLTAGNVTLADANAMRFATTNLTGNLIETAVGPIAQTGTVVVAGTTNITVTDGGFGYADPYILLNNGSNNFGGAVTLSATSAGQSGTGGYVNIVDVNALTLGTVNTARAVSLSSGGSMSAGTITAGTTLNINATGGGSVTLGTTGTTSAGGDMSLGSQSSVTLQGTTSVGGNFNLSANGAVSVGTTSVSGGTGFTINTAGAVTDTGTITVNNFLYIAAGSANDITLDTPTNNFNYVRIGSGNNVTFFDTNAVNLGPFGGSVISGNLAITAGGSITQYSSHDNNSPITVAGTSTFTTTAANSDLILGPIVQHYIDGWTGAQNNFAGAITIATSGAGAWRDISVKNINSGAGVISGLGAGLRDVLFYFDNASSISVPGMTLSGNLIVDASSGSITQSGALVVDNGSAGTSTFRSATTGDITLTNAGNDFNRITIRQGRDASIVDQDAIELYTSNVYFNVTRDLTVTAGGAIIDTSQNNNLGYYMNIGSGGSGTATFTAGSGNNVILDNDFNLWRTVAVVSSNNFTLNPRQSLVLGNVNASGTMSLDSREGGTLTQVASTAVAAGGNTTFWDFTSGITLNNANNVFGNLHIQNTNSITLRENDAITQNGTWNLITTSPVVLTTSNDQAITLDASNNWGNLTLTQINNGASSAGAVYVREVGDGTFGLTQGGAWTLHGNTTIVTDNYSINLNNPNNILGPLQISGATGNTNGVASTVTIYARDTATTDAITDFGAWNTGTGVVRLVAYDTTGTTAGGGDIYLLNTGNVLGDLYIKATNATITENSSITDGASTIWNAQNDTGWMTTGTTTLIVANPTSRTITLDNLTNQLGALAVSTTGAGTLTSALITDNTDITQTAVWNVGAAPVTLDARNHHINLSTSGNVLGALSINTTNGMPLSVSITENDAITQGSAWIMSGVPVTLNAQNGSAITLTTSTNVLGNLIVTGGAVSITENDGITQGGAWTTTGTTTLNATANAITLADASNVLGALAITGTPSSVIITENDNITQSAAWNTATTAYTLTAGGGNSILLSQASNVLGDLTLSAANATVTENHAAGITDGSAWNISGTTTLTAGSSNPIVLNANPASDFGTVSIVSASNADVADTNGIVIGASTIAAGGTFTVTAGGAITQSGAITAPSLRLIGAGSATLNNASNAVGTLAAGFSGGDLAFTNAGSFAVGVVGGTSGVTIGANDVTLNSVSGTITGLSNINASSTSLALTTGTALSLPQMSIAGTQTYTAGGGGITLTSGITSSAAGSINFMSAVTLAADLSIQSTNSAINFASTLAGAGNQLTVNAGTGTVTFQGAVSALGSTGDASAALQITSTGATFDSTLSANNGLAITGPVVFSDTVTLADGNAASVFTGLVTLGRAGGMNLSGYDGMTFNGGVLLQNGPATINSNNSALAFQTAGTVSGPYGLTLNSGTQSLIGLNRMGSDLTSLSVTALSPTIPAGGVTINGPQSYTATAGSSITLQGNVTSTASGAITFNSPVLVGASSTVTSTNSNVTFASTLNGNNDLTVNAGSGLTTFTGAVGGVSALGDGTGAALILQGSGASTFSSTLQTLSGITAAGPVTFTSNVTLGNGNTGSVFSGLVTSGGASGNSISGYDGISFGGGLALTGGAVSVASNGSTLALGGAVSGTQSLTLNALAGGAGTVTGLDQIGFASTLTGLTVTAQTLSLPSTGLAVAGPMTFTAAGGITLNGAVGDDNVVHTGAINFNGPVTLATGAITVTSDDAAVTFAGAVDGGQNLAVNAGTGTTTFGGAVGAGTALTSLATDAGGITAINGGSIRTTAAQSYNDAVTLGANTTLTGVDVEFRGTLNGARTLLVNDSGATLFGGVVGGSAALTSLTTDAAGSVLMDATAVTTTGAQTYNDEMEIRANVAFSGIGLSFANIDGAYALAANAGSGALTFNGSVGANTPLTAVTAAGNALAAADVWTVGPQSYTGSAITLNGSLIALNSNVTVTGPTTLGADVFIATAGGNILFSGSPSTINGAHELTLAAGTGNVDLGGVVGGIVRLTGITVEGYDLTLPSIATVGDLNQSYTALNNIALNQSRTVNAPISFTADSDNDGSGSFILLNGVSLTASNNTLTIQAADLDLQGNSTLSTGSGVMTINASNGRNLALGGANAAGQLTISGAELARMSSSGGLTLNTTGTGWIRVNGITQTESQNITGTLNLHAQGTGDLSFITAASTFNAVRTQATGGTINVGVDLTTTNDAIDFLTPVSVSGASTIASGGGSIAFAGSLAVDNDLTLSTGNGNLSFGGPVGSNRVLLLNLGGGSVTGLSQLQSALTGLTINGTSGLTLPALSINGPMVFNTGPITVTGDLSGIGISFANLVDVVPGVGTALSMNARTGTLSFSQLVSFNAVDMTLIGDEINFARAVTGSGDLEMRAFTGSRNTVVGSAGAPIAGLNLTAAELAWLPIGTLSSLTIGNAAGTGSLDMAGVLNAPGTPLTLNGGGGITQSGGSITSGALSLYAAGAPISLTSAGNAFGAVGITGSPTALSLRNTLDITQLGASAWALGSAPVTLNAGTHDITLGNAGNTFGTLVLTGGDLTITEAASSVFGVVNSTEDLVVDSAGAIALDGALNVAGHVALTGTGTVTQSAPLTIGGDLTIATSVAAGDVTLNNSGSATTSLGNTLVGGDYTLTATGGAVSQAAGSSVQVRGDLTVTGASIVLGGAGNLVGGTTSLPATSTVELRQSGAITLGNRNDTGNLTVISERTNRSFGSALVGGDAIVLDNAANNIGGRISVSASPATILTGADVQTGINQTAGTSITVAGVASFTAEASSAGSLGINLTNVGNNFGVLQLSGTTVDVRNSAAGLTTLQSAVASTSLTLNAAGAVAQSGAVITPTLAINANGAVTLNNIGNDTTSLSLNSGGNAISYVDTNSVAITALNSGSANASLTAGGSGNITQTGAITVGTLSANAGGSVTLTNAINAIAALGASTAGSGFSVRDAGGLAITGVVRTIAGSALVRSTGDITMASGSRLQADAGSVVVSTEGTGNFLNSGGASALVAGGGNRWLVYSNTPDLAAGAHTIKDGLTSSFRHYGGNYTSYAPGSVVESGNGFIYADAAPTLSVSAAIAGSATHVYGDTPTGSLSYQISAGLLDSEDNVSNVITGGAATFSAGLSNTMDAGIYSVVYTGGLTSTYTLIADPTGATYTVTPAVLTYTANTATRVYGGVNPALSGSISGFRLGQNASVLGGGATWTTTAVAGSPVGQYAITGGGYTATNYTFAQAAGNATAFDITRAALLVTANGDSRAYNGTGYTGGAGVTYSGFANGESASVIGGTLVYGGSSQGARNVGNYTLTASGLTSGNYDISYASGTLAITRANLVLSSTDVVKTYDGSIAAVGTATAVGGTQIFGGDSVTGGNFAFTNANAGSGNRTVTLNGVTVNDGNGGSNYNVSYVANTTSTINRAGITVAASDVARTYDGTTAATSTAVLVGGSLFSNASNGNQPDTLSGGSFAFASANAGVGNRTVTTSGVTVNDGNAGGNYNISYANNTTSTINPALLTFGGTIASRVYDGTTAATLTGYTLNGFIGGETVNASAAAAAFLNANAGTGKTVNISGISLSNGTNGGLASNYMVAPTATATGNITPRLLTLSATVADRTYDGTTNATLLGYGLSGFVGSETVSGVVTGSARFDDKHVGTDKPISITGIVLIDGANGGLAANYLAPTSAISTADITAASLQVAGIVALDRVYDGTTTAYLDTQSAGVTGVFGSDEVSISSISGSFSTKDVGDDKPIIAGTVVLGGADAGDYVLIQPAGLSASITPRTLVVGATAGSRVYDGTTAATVSLTDNRIAGDVLTINSSAAFMDRNVGSGKFVDVSGIALSGADAGNYSVNSNASAFADITRANLVVTAVGTDRVYDGTTAATVTLNGTPITGDDVALSFASASFEDKNAGNDKTVNVTGVSASGADAGNYNVSTLVATTADITPATLVVTATGESKPYDGNTIAVVALTDNRIVGDQLTVTRTGAAFADPDVGDDKPITVTGVQVAGVDSGNYVLASGTVTGAADITAPDNGAGPGSTASLPPVLPQPPAAVAPTPPPSVIQTTLPTTFGFSGVPAASDASVASAGSGQIMVAVVRSSSEGRTGMVTVRVPAAFVAPGMGFSFPLPAPLSDAAEDTDVQVSLADGRALPSWLRYVPLSKNFAATATPAGALPVEVLVSIGDRSWTVVISEEVER
jgi:filamentous hemagglutinin family protein